MNNQYDYESSADHHQSISELPEYDVAPLNLGVEDPEDMATPVIGSEDPSGTVNMNVVAKRRSWSPTRWDSRALKGTKEVVDMDCGICFENAVMPCQTRCCGRLFCLEHIADWLHGPYSNQRCPSCQSPCTLSLSSLVPNSSSRSASPPTSPTPRPLPQHNIQQYVPTSPTPSTSSITSGISNTSCSSSTSSNTSTTSHSTWASFSRTQPNNADLIRRSCSPVTKSSSLTPKPSTFGLPLPSPKPHITHHKMSPRPQQVIYDRESLLAPKEWGPIIGKVLSFVGLMLVYYALFS